MSRYLTKRNKGKPLFQKSHSLQIEDLSNITGQSNTSYNSTTTHNNNTTPLKALNQSTPHLTSKLKCKRKKSLSLRKQQKRQKVLKHNSSVDSDEQNKSIEVGEKTLDNSQPDEDLNTAVIAETPSQIKEHSDGENEFENLNVKLSESDFTLTNSINVTSVNESLENKTIDIHALSDLDVTESIGISNNKPVLTYPTNTFYGLPLKVNDLLKTNRGISKLYDWQDECLKLPAVLNHRNIIYSLPTSGGKTLVAEVIILNELINRMKNVILVLPYVSIVQEKVRIMSPFAVEFEFHIEEYAASKGCMPPKKRRKNRSLYIATIEKGNGIVNSLIDSERLEEIGLVVVDELHMIGDGSSRGAALEMLLAKLLYKLPSVQIVGMSATLGNIDELQQFLKADIYTNNFRPVELKEFVKLGDTLYEVNSKAHSDEELLRADRKISHSSILNRSIKSHDPDHIVSLVLEVIPENSCLLFCATKKHCENVALLLSKYLPSNLKDIKKEERLNLLTTIHQSANGICRVLSKTIPFGIAYHHSGLTMDERKLIEESYSDGTLKLLCCTSTLAAGVNLPAKRAILRSPYVGISPISRSQYKQMIGRAGRAGLDQSGESILIASPKDKQKLLSLILSGDIDKCKSSMLYENGKGVRQLILNLLGLNICSSVDALQAFIEGTLYFVQMKKQSSNASEELSSALESGVNSLKENGFLTTQTIDGESGTSQNLTTTKLGNATYKAFIDLDLAPFIFSELKKSLNGLVLANELHMLYLATPFDAIESVKVNWMTYFKLVSKFKEGDAKVAELIGVAENKLMKKACGQGSSKDKLDERVYTRFYLTLILSSLMRKNTIWQVSNFFDVPRGFLQNLLASTVSLTSSLIHFTQEIEEFSSLKLLFEELLKKLSNANDYELEELMEIPAVKRARARQLYKKGYHKLKDVAKADVKKLCGEIEYLPRNQANLIVSSAKMLLRQKIESLLEEADEMALSTE